MPPGEVAAVKWRFNGWAKYENHLRDEAAGIAIPGLGWRRLWRPDMVLEGGSIDVNGAGLLLTTEECLLSPVQARNPDLVARGNRIRAAANISASIACSGCTTESPATIPTATSTISRASPIRETIVIVSEEDRTDANYEPLRENWEILKHFPVRARKLPMPAPLYFDGQRLPASYANFYIANQTGAGADFQRSERSHRAERAGRMFPEPPGDRNQLRGTGLGAGNPALHDAAAARLNREYSQHHTNKSHPNRRAQQERDRKLLVLPELDAGQAHQQNGAGVSGLTGKSSRAFPDHRRLRHLHRRHAELSRRFRQHRQHAEIE